MTDFVVRLTFEKMNLRVRLRGGRPSSSRSGMTALFGLRTRCTYIYIYIYTYVCVRVYIERGGEGEREREREQGGERKHI